MRDESALWNLLWRNARDNRPDMLILRAISLSRHDLPAFAAQGKLVWGSHQNVGRVLPLTGSAILRRVAGSGFNPQIKAHIGASDGAFGLAMLVTAAGAVTAVGVATRCHLVRERRCELLGPASRPSPEP